MERDAVAGRRGEAEARVVLGVPEDDGEVLATSGRLGEECFDDEAACATALAVGTHRARCEADAGGIADEAAGEHSVSDDLTVTDSDDRQAFDPIAGFAEGVDDLSLGGLVERGGRQRTDRVDVAGSFGTEGELRCGRCRHDSTIAIGGATLCT